MLKFNCIGDGTHNKKLHTHNLICCKGEIPIEKNVIVTDEFGNKLGFTYPKRAFGLLKKGRAELVSEHEIRLLSTLCPPITEDNMNTNITDNNNTYTVSTDTGEVLTVTPKKDNQVFLDAKQWTVSKDCNNTVASRTFISDPFGNMSEAWLLGDWSWNRSQIETRDMILDRNTDYVFAFWLNGGENDQNNETCQFEIVFDNDGENRSIYKLNRNYIRYEKHYKGWYLYKIPFNTGDASYTRFRFVAMRAYTAILPAKDLSEYDKLPVDLPQANVPQRHNIIFNDGFPHDSWWSKNVFGEDDPANPHAKSQTSYTTSNNFDKMNESFTEMGEEFKNVGEKIRQQVMQDIDVDSIIDDIASDIQDEIDEDDIAEQIKSSIDVESIKKAIIDSLKNK